MNKFEKFLRKEKILVRAVFCYARAHHIGYALAREQVIHSGGTLVSLFSWEDTEEGDGYWRGLHNLYLETVPDPYNILQVVPRPLPPHPSLPIPTCPTSNAVDSKDESWLI